MPYDSGWWLSIDPMAGFTCIVKNIIFESSLSKSKEFRYSPLSSSTRIASGWLNWARWTSEVSLSFDSSLMRMHCSSRNVTLKEGSSSPSLEKGSGTLHQRDPPSASSLKMIDVIFIAGANEIWSLNYSRDIRPFIRQSSLAVWSSQFLQRISTKGCFVHNWFTQRIFLLRSMRNGVRSLK